MRLEYRRQYHNFWPNVIPLRDHNHRGVQLTAQLHKWKLRNKKKFFYHTLIISFIKWYIRYRGKVYDYSSSNLYTRR